MNEKLTLQDLATLLAERHEMEQADAVAFVQTMFTLIKEGLTTDRYVKIKGLGTFKLLEVDSRESVNIHTGERIEIQSHNRISFTPDPALKDFINKPFAHFETVILNENVHFDDLEKTEEQGIEPDILQKQAEPSAPETEETSDNTGTPRGEIHEQNITESGNNALPQQKPSAENNADKSRHTQSAHTSARTLYFTGLAVLIAVTGIMAAMCLYNKDIPNKKPAEKHIGIPDTLSAEKPTPHDTPVISIPPLPEDTLVATQEKLITPKTQTEKKETLADTTEYEITGTLSAHVIKVGDTLARLARKFYGETKMWPYIVKHNQNIINNADNIPIGTKIRIPRLKRKKQSGE